MNFYTQLRAVERRFILIVMSLVVGSVLALGVLMYEANLLRFDEEATSEDLQALVEDQPAVAEYLEEEKDFEAHFITITNLVKDDQQRELGNILIVATLGTIVLAACAGWLAARYLLRPVRLSYQSQERFLQDAAHELRNPLAAMNTALQAGTPSTKKAQADFMTTMKRQTNRLIRINEDLLYLERRKPGAKVSEINISELLHDVIEDMQPMIVEKNLTLKTEIEDNLLRTMDTNDFIKLSRNIIENAIKYTPRKKTIAITLAATKSGLRFSVADQGIGIPKSDLEHIGERFYRASNANKHDGTGLGMAIVQKVCYTYGAQLNIESTVKKGTTVTIDF